jgi:hypothetical protein
MARIPGAVPSRQGFFRGLLTRIVYSLTKRKLGRVVMPVQVTAHHPQNPLGLRPDGAVATFKPSPRY